MRLTPDTVPEDGVLDRALLRAILTTLQEIATDVAALRELLEADR